MKKTGIVLAVCSLVICFACSCAEKTDAELGQSDEVSNQADAGLNQPFAGAVQQTEDDRYDYDKVISEINAVAKIKDQRDALETTHYCLEILALIDPETYPNKKLDKFELERQFRRIASEDYNFKNFQDDTLQLLKDVIDRIKDLRISEGDRELLDELYNQEKRRAWMRVLPQNMAVLISAEWKQLVANSVQTLIYSTFNYLKIKGEIETRYRKESWELDKRVIENDSVFIQRRLTDLYQICKRYNVEHVAKSDIQSLLKQFNAIEAKLNNGLMNADLTNRIPANVPDKVWKQFNDARETYRSKVNESRYRLYSTYWYQRGYLAWLAYNDQKRGRNEEDREEAMGCFKVYQELTRHSIVKYNPVAIDVAMMQIALQQAGEKTDRGFLQDQLRIILDNRNQNSLDYQFVCFFCGQVYYYALKNYDNATEMFKISEKFGNDKRTEDIDNFCSNLSGKIKEFEGSDQAAIGDFAVKDSNQKPHFLPKFDAEFLARMGYYDSRIKAGKDINDAGNNDLVDMISNEASCPYISPWEFLSYAAYVKEDATKKEYYEEILPKVLKCENFDSKDYFEKNPDWKSYPVGKQPLPYELKYLSFSSNFWSKDCFYLELPYQYALLSDIKVSMELLCCGEVVTSVPCDSKTMAKDGDNIFLCLEFPLNEKELIKKNIDGIRFDFEYKYFKSAITFDFGGGLTKSMDSDFYKELPGYITFELKDLDDLKNGSPLSVGARR